MSPVFILSRLCLKRRFQFFGIAVPPPVSALVTFLTISSSMTCLRPTASAFSHGTLTVMSLCRILIVRYSRFSPRTRRFSFFTIVPAPWCGYTTLSPTLNKPSSPTGRGSTRQDADGETPPAKWLRVYQKSRKSATFSQSACTLRLQTGQARSARDQPWPSKGLPSPGAPGRRGKARPEREVTRESELEVAIDEIVFLEPAEPLADVSRPRG